MRKTNPIELGEEISKRSVRDISDFVVNEVEPGLDAIDYTSYKEKYPTEEYFYITVKQIFRAAEKQGIIKIKDRNTFIYNDKEYSRNTAHKEIIRLLEKKGYQKIKKGLYGKRL